MSVSLPFINSTSRTIRNQHYLTATATNALGNYLYSSFASLSNANTFYGCVWVYLASALTSTNPVTFVALAENNGMGATIMHTDLVWVSGDTMNIAVGLGFTTSTEPGITAAYTIQTSAPVIMQAGRWHKIKFYFNTNDATLTNNIISLNNVDQGIAVKSGGLISSTYNMTNARIMGHAIPVGFRMAQAYLGTGTLTKAEFATYEFGQKAPIWLNKVGGLVGKPAVVYMHGTRNVIENSVNGVAFTGTGTNFTSLVHATNRADFVVIP